MRAGAHWSPRYSFHAVDDPLEGQVAAIERAADEADRPLPERELLARTNARHWGPGVARRALRRAVVEGRIARDGSGYVSATIARLVRVEHGAAARLAFEHAEEREAGGRVGDGDPRLRPDEPGDGSERCAGGDLARRGDPVGQRQAAADALIQPGSTESGMLTPQKSSIRK